MKWYFALNEEGTTGGVGLHARFAILSAIRNTALRPYLLYIGQRNDFTEWAESKGVTVVDSDLPYIDTIISLVEQGRYTMGTCGHWLRTNICRTEQSDEFVLYTDVDVLFRKNPELDQIRPTYFAAAPEFRKYSWNYFNAGVMLVNVPGLNSEYDAFEKYLVENISELTYGFNDQIAYNQFYRGRWDRLPLGLNWKPYWGINHEAALVHFHGPKLSAIEAILAGNWDWKSNHGRQIGSLFASFLGPYRYYIRVILDNAHGLDEQNVARIAELVRKVDAYDGRLNGAIDLSFTDFQMFPQT
jgi:hypothetical protein